MATKLTMSDQVFCNSITPRAESVLEEKVRLANEVVARLYCMGETAIRPTITVYSTDPFSLTLIAYALIPLTSKCRKITNKERDCLNVAIGHIKGLVKPDQLAVIDAMIELY